jgi:hypothetical protein
MGFYKQVRPAVRAYIHKGLCVMFTTMPYTLDPKLLGGSTKGTFEPVCRGALITPTLPPVLLLQKYVIEAV